MAYEVDIPYLFLTVKTTGDPNTAVYGPGEAKHFAKIAKSAWKKKRWLQILTSCDQI